MLESFLRRHPCSDLVTPVALLVLAACGEDPVLTRTVSIHPHEGPSAPEASISLEGGSSTGVDAESERFEDAGPRPAGIDVQRGARTDAIYLHTSDTLFLYEPALGEIERVGRFLEGGRAVPAMIDIAIDAHGALYAGAIDGSLFRVDPETAACRFLRGLPEPPRGLAGLPDGRIASAGRRIVLFDPEGAGADELVPIEASYVTSGDLVAGSSGDLYWTVMARTDRILRIDLASGRSTLVADSGDIGLFGLVGSGGVLYAFTRDGQLLAIDPEHGQIIERVELAGAWWGAAAFPPSLPLEPAQVGRLSF